ncbi:Ig-like domain-containing protein [Heyndrickxia sporothermodurans]
MKKLIISLITAILLIIGQISPVFANENITLTFSTNKSDYVPGETIILKGKILKGQDAGKGTKPTLQFINPSGKVKQVEQWEDSEIGNDGSISKNIFLAKTIESGTYTIKVSASGVQQTSQVFISGSASSKRLTISTDKNKYKIGEQVIISGHVSKDNQQVGGTKITITVENDKGSQLKTIELISNKEGDFSTSFETNDSEGTYIVKAQAIDADPATTKFEVYVDNTTPKPDPGIPTPTDPIDPKPEPQNPGTDTTAPKAPKVNEIKDYDKKITGTSEGNAVIKVKAGKTMLGTGKADKNGKFTISLKKAQKAGTVLYVTATDQEGNESSATKVIVKDKIAPKAPTVNKVYSTSTKISGKAEENSKIEIKNGNKKIGSATTNNKGQYSVIIKKQKAGAKLSVTATDRAGNKSKAATVIVIDKTPPNAPTVNSVKSSSTKITGKAEPGARVYAKVGKKIIGSATVNQKGNYSIKIKKQKRGSILSVYAKDKAGNIGKAKKVTLK